ncbi:MAG: hypothetical protein LUG16_07790 [Candidatus Gastranaerophilales bacterium]|nr:hypothetical protein [Candidatus Gastranaerophilales bacterium]
MNTRIKYNFIQKLCMAFCILLLSGSWGFAAENAISAIDVKQTQNGYDIFLKVDKNVQIKKYLDGKDNLTIILDSTQPSDSMEIVYDNTSNLENVIVQKKNDENTLILIQGKNISNSKIYTKEISTGITKQIEAKNSYIFIADRKILVVSIFSMALLFLMMLAARPKNKRYNSVQINSKIKNKKPIKTTTLRSTKPSNNAPSINYTRNGKFASTTGVTIPKDFVISEHQFDETEENIRKVG